MRGITITTRFLQLLVLSGVVFGEITYKTVNSNWTEVLFENKPRIEIFKNESKLVVRNQYIPVLRKELISIKYGLSQLFIVECNITDIEAGIHENISPLQYLEITGNNIKVIKSGIFNDLNVQALSLGNNSIETIETTAFDNNKVLREINLEHNKITNLNPDWFTNTPNMANFIDNHNQLQHVPANAFKNAAKDKLLTIWLSANKITKIHPNALDGLDSIVFLDLSNNLIETIPESLYLNKTILMLNLAHNKLKELPETIFSANVKSLNLNENELSEVWKKQVMEKGLVKKI